MRYNVSTCSYYKMLIRRMFALPEDFGAELFIEYGSDDYWDSFLREFTANHYGPISIHAPFAFVDIAADCDEKRLFETLRKSFELYHRYKGEFLVLHPYGEVRNPDDETYLHDCRERSMDRLARFQSICKENGVRLAAENLCGTSRPLYNQEEYLKIFEQIPDIHAVIDIGHLLVNKMDITLLQKTLRDRICAYHLHNNDGLDDSHCRVQEGIMNWKAFAEGFAQYTPHAVGVLEYLNERDASSYAADRDYLESLLKEASNRV